VLWILRIVFSVYYAGLLGPRLPVKYMYLVGSYKGELEQSFNTYLDLRQSVFDKT
jgi:hypothetical protein